jgi:hypothetical protein
LLGAITFPLQVVTFEEMFRAMIFDHEATRRILVQAIKVI